MKVLFQGDSVTDAGRDRRDFHQMGKGYPGYAAECLREQYPDLPLTFINLGISGNRTDQLFDRLYDDAIALEPDVISVLIGINDVWHRYSHHIETTDEQFECNYRAILERLKKQTHAKIVVMAPFLLDCEDKDEIRRDLTTILPIVRRLADTYADVYVPLDELFAAALPQQPEPHFYSADGVHPNAEGAAFIGKHCAAAIAKCLH